MKEFEKYDFKKNLGYCSPEYKNQWHRNAIAALKALANELGLTSNQYDLRSNKAGIACSGEVTLHTDNIYIQLSADMEQMGRGILYRKCGSRKDYRGQQNNFLTINKIRETKEFANKIKDFLNPNID